MVPFLWLILLAVLLIMEAVTAGLTTIWFAGGALVAAVASYFGAGLLIQIFVFCGVSFVLLIFTRPIAVKYMNQKVESTNVNSLIGQKAVVIQQIHNLTQTGQVKINDVEWTARTYNDDIIIPEKAIVVIKEVKGVKLIVELYKEG